MNDLVVFAFERQNRKVRTVKIDGQAWFAGVDVCDLLGFKNASDAMNNHCRGVAKRYPLATPGGIQEMRIISQADVLRLITNSTLPEAMRIEAWFFEEVIPTVLRTGAYGKPVQNALPGSKRPLLEDVREQFEAENVQNDIKNSTTDAPLLQFVLENLEYSPRVSDYIPVKDAYKLYLTYPAENPLPIEQFAIDVCGVPGSNMNICLSKGRLTHCKIKESVPVLRLT
jgi:prophage antirepressor-like protein